MDFESWWLIFVPLLFALGWLAARFDIRQILSETRNLPDSYFRGLNFLLNEEPDRAIDAFVEVAKLDPETTELHFALGSLFRRRGEMERAIRVLATGHRIPAVGETGVYVSADLGEERKARVVRLLSTRCMPRKSVA